MNPDLSMGEAFKRSVVRGGKQVSSAFGDVIPAMIGSAVGADEFAKRQMEEAAGTQEEIARKYAAVVATGRSDQPNQINNVLAFPGIFRGLLDGRITKITDAMLVAAADAISSCVSSDQLNANFIVPSVFDTQVVTKVAEAIKLMGRSNS
jgi:hypothetical protein